jgi:hypothetical protein
MRSGSFIKQNGGGGGDYQTKNIWGGGGRVRDDDDMNIESVCVQGSSMYGSRSGLLG